MHKAKSKGEMVQLLWVPIGMKEKSNKATVCYNVNMRDYTMIN